MPTDFNNYLGNIDEFHNVSPDGYDASHFAINPTLLELVESIQQYVIDKIGTPIYIGNVLSERVNFSSEPQAQINSKQNRLTETQIQDIDSIRYKALFTDLSYENLLINSNFKINQRGKSEYIGNISSVDRWSCRVRDAKVNVVNDGILFTNTSTGNVWASLIYYLEQPLKNNTNYTLSFSCEGIVYSGTVKLPATYSTGEKLKIHLPNIPIDVTLNGDTSKVANGYAIRLIVRNSNYSARFNWIKLEEGDTATKYQEPEPITELVKCQRYYRIFSNSATLPTSKYDYAIEMFRNPTTGTINIDGIPFKYADAEL